MAGLEKKLSIVMFGAHPDDCELKAGGTAAKWAALGHTVQFVAMTGGDNGHPSLAGGALQQQRRHEAADAAQRLGISRSIVLDHHGGELLPTMDVRREVVRLIREAHADIVITHRSTDYHPDHRYTSMAVQDAAYMVTVPFFLSSVPALERNPLFLYFEDNFKRPVPFQPDIAVPIDDVFDAKMLGIEAHASQMFEWTPFMISRTNGRPEPVPEDPNERRRWLENIWFPSPISAEVREQLRATHGSAADSVQRAEAFEICEYGRTVNSAEIKSLFPF